jgi:hypothetical protein
MSHKATNWLADIPPKALTNAEFRILFVLCDCHNPSAGCFPKQSYIMAKTGRGNSSVNDALAGLEAKGFIRREQRTNPKTGKREATLYILGFEMDGPLNPTPNSGDGNDGPKPEQNGSPTPISGDGSISGFSPDPSPVFGPNHLRKTGVVYKEEPVKEPVKEPCAAEPAPTLDDCSDDLLREFERVFPKLGAAQATRNAIRKTLATGATPDQILDAARAYAAEQQGNDPKYIRRSERFFADDFWRAYIPAQKSTPSAETVAFAEQWGKTIREVGSAGSGHFMFGKISRDTVTKCLAARTVTAEDCRRAGLGISDADARAMLEVAQ